MIYILDFRGLKGGTVRSGILRNESDDEIAGGLQGEMKITFLVHGYNWNRKEAKANLLRFARALPRETGTYVCVFWPGDNSYLGPLSFPFEGRDADDTAVEFAKYIKENTAAEAVLSFVAHSLGARVVLEAVDRLRASRTIAETCLLAAAIDDCSVSDPKTYRQAVERTRRVSVLASTGDDVLRFAYPAGDLFQSFIFSKDRAGLALGYHGPRKRDAADVPMRVYHEQISMNGHGDYVPADPANDLQKAAINFVSAILRGADKPQYERS